MDNIAAEVARLEAFGALQQDDKDTFWAMEDPCGNQFYVVSLNTPDFSERAKTWEV